MPKVVDNEDGTKSITINSSELRALKNLVDSRVPDFKKLVEIVESPDFRATIGFLKSVVS
jgi:hypothetical protein